MIAHISRLVMKDVGCSNTGLCVELCGVRDLEEDVHHAMGAAWPLELEGFTLWRGQNRGRIGITNLE